MIEKNGRGLHAHLILQGECVGRLKWSRDCSRSGRYIVAHDVEQARHDTPVQALQVVEQGRPKALDDASIAHDVEDCKQNSVLRERGGEVQMTNYSPSGRGLTSHSLSVEWQPTNQ